MSVPGIILAAPASGCGKTVVALGIIAALAEAGTTVQPFKSGPDYIDPAFHALAAGRPSFNLDSWAMARDRIAGLIARAADADLALMEGAVGLFDGVTAAGEAGHGTTAEIAAMTGWPVVLVLDVTGQAQSAAAAALGLATWSPDVRVAGVILNRVASDRHERLVRAGLERTGLPVLGVLPRDPLMVLPERHLGLVQAGEQPELAARLAALAAFVAAHVDLAGLRALAGPCALTAVPAAVPPPPAQRIAMARDAAFSFAYPAMLADWREAGAEILPFSPLADEGPDDGADLCWLPGGYPELHAGRLAAATRFLSGLRDFARTRPVHGECGGYMVMGEALIDKDGMGHRMAGLLGLETSFATRRLHLGYRLAELTAPMPGHGPGERLRGHEYHYATILAQPDEPLARITDVTGAPVPETGSRRGHATGSFFHRIAPATS